MPFLNLLKKLKRSKKITPLKTKMPLPSGAVTVENLEAMNAYFIHNNGGRPFAVVDKGGYVDVYKFGITEDNDVFYTYYGKIAYDKIMLGKDVKYTGNSILLKKGNAYIYIGDERILKFKKEGQEILDFMSPVGPNDVPYPYAVSKDYMYLIITSARVSLTDEVLDIVVKDFTLGPYTAFWKGKLKSTPMNIIDWDVDKQKPQKAEEQIGGVRKRRAPRKPSPKKRV